MKYMYLLLLLVIIVACSPSESPEADVPQEPEAPETAPEAQETEPQQQPEQQAPVEQEQAAQESPEYAQQLSDILDAQETLEFQATYDMTTTTQGQTSSGEMTQYFKGNDKIRLDVEMQEISSKTFVIDQVVTSCTDATGSEMCFELDTSETTTAVNTDLDVADYEVTQIDGRIIAGAGAECYNLVAQDGTVEYCFAPEGVPLYVKTVTDGAETTLVATSYSTSVADSVFDVPAAQEFDLGNFDPSQFT